MHTNRILITWVDNSDELTMSGPWGRSKVLGPFEPKIQLLEKFEKVRSKNEFLNFRMGPLQARGPEAAASNRSRLTRHW